MNKLIKYLKNNITKKINFSDFEFPLQNESHIEFWKYHINQNQYKNYFDFLKNNIVQFKIPIKKNISKSKNYKNVLLFGEPFFNYFNEELVILQPDNIQLKIYSHFAGELPVIITDNRKDFETLYRVLAFKNEPKFILPSINAVLISGFINRARLNYYSKNNKSTYTDTIILINANSGYSSISADKLPEYIDINRWLVDSAKIRIEHEFTHYAAKRIYNKKVFNIFDEIIADCMALTLLYNKFDANLFLLFLGLNMYPKINNKGRIYAYINKKNKIEKQRNLFELLIKAAYGLEKFVNKYYDETNRELFFIKLYQLDIHDLIDYNEKNIECC